MEKQASSRGGFEVCVKNCIHVLFLDQLLLKRYVLYRKGLIALMRRRGCVRIVFVRFSQMTCFELMGAVQKGKGSITSRRK